MNAAHQGIDGLDRQVIANAVSHWPLAGLAHSSYSVIYADPPWSFKAWSARGESRSASRHYDCMTLSELCSLPVADLATKDAALFVWVVQPLIPQALHLIEAWGFTYKTVAFAWVKVKTGQDRLFYAGEDVRLGLGYHTRSGFEQCWLATRGKGYQRLTRSEPQVIFAPVREHSRKPDEVAEAIERLVGDVSRIELFARAKRNGWASYGNEREKFSPAGAELGRSGDCCRPKLAGVCALDPAPTDR